MNERAVGQPHVVGDLRQAKMVVAVCEYDVVPRLHVEDGPDRAVVLLESPAQERRQVARADRTQAFGRSQALGVGSLFGRHRAEDARRNPSSNPLEDGDLAALLFRRSGQEVVHGRDLGDERALRIRRVAREDLRLDERHLLRAIGEDERARDVHLAAEDLDPRQAEPPHDLGITPVDRAESGSIVR